MVPREQEYDCIIRLSEGIDSSFMAMKAHEWSLRRLVDHIDSGWDSELAVDIQKSVTSWSSTSG